jgi:hypothetical protein
LALLTLLALLSAPPLTVLRRLVLAAPVRSRIR